MRFDLEPLRGLCDTPALPRAGSSARRSGRVPLSRALQA
jgi:hypothetical protein